MNAFILAAGFGTRLKPWTDLHPKALVQVNNQPMLALVLERLEMQGFGNVVVNVHHFSDQIIDFINNYKSTQHIGISDESQQILDTGGGLLKALSHFKENDSPVLVHNVDILSDAPLREIYNLHINSRNDISLLTSNRKSSRSLIFDQYGFLKGWCNNATSEFKPSKFTPTPRMHRSSFSGIYIVNRKVEELLSRYKCEQSTDVFPIIDFFLWAQDKIKIGEIKSDKLNLIDIGKPDTLSQAEEFITSYL